MHIHANDALGRVGFECCNFRSPTNVVRFRHRLEEWFHRLQQLRRRVVARYRELDLLSRTDLLSASDLANCAKNFLELVEL